jgi:D-threo-aldose 1-dehydrogenase
MKQVLLDRTSLRLSRFGFGTGGLLNAGSSRRRQRLLAAAYQYGITHFDTAPYYGFGMAERDLRPLLRQHPDATVATKVGIYPPGGADQLTFSVLVRKAGGTLFPSLSKPTIDWCVERARKSLDGSLRRLGRDHIDLYLLHEPEAHLVPTDEWLAWLDSERDRVAAFGIACDIQRLPPFLINEHPLARVVQCSDSVDGREADVLLKAGRPLEITYGYLSASAAQHRNFRAETVLAAALRRNFAGCILVFTSKEERLQIFADIARKDELNTNLERSQLP